MHFVNALNITCGSLLILGIIFADYSRKYNTDPFQRALFFAILGLTAIPLVADFLYILLQGSPGRKIHLLFWTTNFFYYLFQVAAYYGILLFMDYSAYKDSRRTRRFFSIALGVTLIHLVILLFNLRWGFYYRITADNYFAMGNKYVVRLIMAYSPLIFVILDALMSIKLLNQHHFSLFVFIFVVIAGGSTLSLFINTVIMFWPFTVAGLLFAYFFIIRSDARIDSLTGIGNRYSFNEFIESLSRSQAKRSYAFVLFDMDHFKRINDTYGHLEGDNALKDLAEILKKSIRQTDFAARYGGDEFIIASRADARIENLIKRIQQAIDDHNATAGRPYRIEVSCGYDVFTTNAGWSITDFLNHIDSLMYKHKGERRRISEAAGKAGRK
jgi:diguanylate cyclase (GGDEF)-like protein